PGYTSINEAKDNSGQIKTDTLIAYQFATGTGTFAPTSVIGKTNNWVGIQLGFHGTSRHWGGGSTDCSGASAVWKDENGTSATAPTSATVVFFDGTSSASCSQAATTWAELHVTSAYTGTLTLGGTLTTSAGVVLGGGTV